MGSELKEPPQTRQLQITRIRQREPLFLDLVLIPAGGPGEKMKNKKKKKKSPAAATP
jgi:hypothetical protein